MISRQKLKPCPFCGGQAEIKDCGSGTYKIECENDCIAGNNHFLRKDIDALVETWNKRASQPPADQWIPCSLAVPKPFNDVLVSYCDCSIGFMHLEYDNKWHDDDWPVAEPEEIIAWQPLPEAYKGE